MSSICFSSPAPSCPGAEASAPAPKVTAEPVTLPATRLSCPMGPMLMVITGPRDTLASKLAAIRLNTSSGVFGVAASFGRSAPRSFIWARTLIISSFGGVSVKLCCETTAIRPLLCAASISSFTILSPAQSSISISWKYSPSSISSLTRFAYSSGPSSISPPCPLVRRVQSRGRSVALPYTLRPSSTSPE